MTNIREGAVTGGLSAHLSTSRGTIASVGKGNGA